MGNRRPVHELGRLVNPVLSRSTVYRVLVGHGVVTTLARKRCREDYRRWERTGVDAAVATRCHRLRVDQGALGPNNLSS